MEVFILVKKKLQALAKNKKNVGIGIAVVILVLLIYFGWTKQQGEMSWEGYGEESGEEEYEEETQPMKEYEEAEGMPTAVSTTTGCMDTDGGLNFALQGTVTAEKIEETDTCSRSDVYKGRLYEEYCTEEGLHARYTYDCPSGVCEDGACG